VDQQGQSSWGPTRRQVLWASGIAALAFLIVVVGGYAFGWEWTGLPKRTFWDWLRLLIIPIVIAGGTIWFNQGQQARQQKQQEILADRESERARHNEIVEALQGEKESVAYIAVRVRERGLPPDNKQRRAELLMALYLAMLFQQADRSRALVFSALIDACQKGYRKEVMEALRRLIDDFTRYENDLGAAQRKLAVEGFDMKSMNKHIVRLQALEKALLEQKEMGLSHE
jgi:hypothetical protein